MLLIIDSMNTSDIRKRVGFAIRSRRQRLHMSQERLGETAGIHRTYIAEVEAGKRNVGLDNLSKIASALCVSLSDLMKEAEDHE